MILSLLSSWVILARRAVGIPLTPHSAHPRHQVLLSMSFCPPSKKRCSHQFWDLRQIPVEDFFTLASWSSLKSLDNYSSKEILSPKGQGQTLLTGTGFATPWTIACQAPLSSTVSQSLLKHMSIELVMPPTISSSVAPFSFCLQSFPASEFSNESALCIRQPKYWRFSFSICPSSEYSELISFRIDWFDLLAVQGTLKNLLQRHSSKASILQHSAFFMV